MTRSQWSSCLGLALLAAACGDRPELATGGTCELNTDCASPLVCRLGRCRNECRSHRDCTVGLSCVTDERGLGACQLPDETECTLTSDCPVPLVCHAGRCTNECATSEDCIAGSDCIEGACVDRSEAPCVYHSQCEAHEFCAPDGRCRPQCKTERDCRDGRVCVDATDGFGYCDWPAPGTDAGIDGGPDGPDAGMDAGVDAGTDAGFDGGTDAGVDAGPPPPSVGILASGSVHSCAAPVPTDPRCWGARYDGTGTAWSATEAEPPAGLPAGDVTMTVSGADHTCAVVGGELLCWGRNQYGQLGRAASTYEATPAAPVTPIRPRAIAAGTGHTCAVTTAGEVLCWGQNASGQLGDGTTTDRHTPAVVPLVMAAVDVTARGRHTCALLDDGSVRCWGRNFEGQLGNGMMHDTIVENPVTVTGIDDAVQIDAGSGHTCALRSSGELWCWGDAPVGPGAGTPALVGSFGSSAIVEVESGVTHICARLADGTVWCWGGNNRGQAGQPTSSLTVDTPTQVSSLTAVEEISTGDYHSCARDGAGIVRCWGWNLDGQLGRSTALDYDEVPGTVAWP